MDPTAAETERDPRRPWQIAVAVLAVFALTMLVITVVLRMRADEAVSARQDAVAAM